MVDFGANERDKSAVQKDACSQRIQDTLSKCGRLRVGVQSQVDADADSNANWGRQTKSESHQERFSERTKVHFIQTSAKRNGFKELCTAKSQCKNASQNDIFVTIYLMENESNQEGRECIRASSAKGDTNNNRVHDNTQLQHNCTDIFGLSIGFKSA